MLDTPDKFLHCVLLDRFKSRAKGTDYTATNAKEGIDNASSSVKDVADKYSRKAEDAVQYASQAYHDVEDVAQQNIGDLERQIRDKPCRQRSSPRASVS